mmetsp:Transcript_77273/g.136248  ORF Transcript_77273/g.136248 Transcript_77273/m.136248 type:complete len:254 (+) Transcript_77273:1007-1768(+)
MVLSRAQRGPVVPLLQEAWTKTAPLRALGPPAGGGGGGGDGDVGNGGSAAAAAAGHGGSGDAGGGSGGRSGSGCPLDMVGGPTWSGLQSWQCRSDARDPRSWCWKWDLSPPPQMASRRTATNRVLGPPDECGSGGRGIGGHCGRDCGLGHGCVGGAGGGDVGGAGGDACAACDCSAGCPGSAGGGAEGRNVGGGAAAERIVSVCEIQCAAGGEVGALAAQACCAGPQHDGGNEMFPSPQSPVVIVGCPLWPAL